MYNHGVDIEENATRVAVPKNGTSAIQFIVGAAPVNLLADPYSVTNVPLLANKRGEADAAIGFSYDWGRNSEDKTKFMYTLCQSVYASFNISTVAPIILLNVLDPKKHVKTNESKTLDVKDSVAILEITGVLRDKTTIKNGDSELEKDVDYVLSFDDNGYLTISLTDSSVTKITVESKSIDPTAVTAMDIVGGYDANTGRNKGLECIEDVFPMFGITPGIIVCPGWSADPVVAAAMNAKTTAINGLFGCEAVVDIDSTSSGATVYTKVKKIKEDNGLCGTHMAALWPMVKLGNLKFYYSAIFAALTAALDIANGDVPYKSPSNKALSIGGLILDDEDSTEVILNQAQANVVNSFGVITAINFNGWRTWGNNTVAFPGTTDPKDRWFACRRMMTYCKNHWILSYFEKVDDPTNLRLTQTIVEAENMWYSTLFHEEKIAGGEVTFDLTENTIQQILDGKIIFSIKVAFFTPAEYILGRIEYDPTILSNYFGLA